MSEEKELFDFKPIGLAIKKAREAKGLTREQLAELFDLAPRHIQSIENEGQHPSFQLFTRLVTLFDISVDQYIFPKKEIANSTKRPPLNTIHDRFDDQELTISEATAKAICNAKEQTEE